MHPRIETTQPKKLIGKRMTMTFSQNKTGELWRQFMPRRNEIQNNAGIELISMAIYTPKFFERFNPNAEFEKWAALEVSDFNSVPEGMDSFELPGGLYAVFFYKGAASAAAPTFQYIFGTWLPASEYELDTRPHFEILGEKYKNDSLDSEEELWIPVKIKGEF